ncbi:MAG: alpha/beta hydrolase [Pseudomonadota bacterium]
MNDTGKYQPQREAKDTRHRVRGVEYRICEWRGEDTRPLVFLHGWGDAAATFQFVVDALPERYRVVAPDWRGFGLSGHTGPAYWFPDYLADLDALLDLYSPEEPVTLIGHSMGANVAGLYAGARPDRVAAFINIEGFGLAPSDPSSAPENYRRWLERSRVGERFATYSSLDELARRLMGRNARLTPERARYVAEQWATQDAAGVVRLRADPAHKLPNAVLYRREEAEACWQAVTAPVLLVTGAETDFRPAVKSWLDPDPERHPFRGAPTTVVPAAGHMVHFDAPDVLAAVIHEFLADV